MSKRGDLVRSWVARAARAGADRLGRIGPWANAKQVYEELRARRASLTEAALGRAVAHAPGVEAGTVSVRDGKLRVDLTYEDGEIRAFALTLDSVRFAPRGAKEVLFAIEPPELAADGRVRDAVGAVAAAIARTLWGPVLPPPRGDEHALVERDGARLRADLRTVPAVRAALDGGGLALIVEALTIESFEMEDRALRLKIGLPFPTV